MQPSMFYNRPSELPLIEPIHPIQLSRSQDLPWLVQSNIPTNKQTYLTPRPLPSHRQTHCMPPPPITTHIPQAKNIFLHFPPQVHLDCHAIRRELGRERRDCLCGNAADFLGGDEGVFCQDTRGVLVADAIECL